MTEPTFALVCGAMKLAASVAVFFKAMLPRPIRHCHEVEAWQLTAPGISFRRYRERRPLVESRRSASMMTSANAPPLMRPPRRGLPRAEADRIYSPPFFSHARPMRLSEFIIDTLYEIALGIEQARLKARDLVAINPSLLDGEQVTEKSYIDFDVSVVVSESQEQSTAPERRLSGEINVASIVKVGGALGDQAKTVGAAKAEQTHRVSFKVPIYMNANYRGNAVVAAEAARLGQACEN